MDVKPVDLHDGRLEESEAHKISIPGEVEKNSSHSFQIRPEFDER
jgi:hypothetical protein